ncbi:MAG TPA: hypothetical protein VE863_16795 [Pyrinomonadaceae bacterium]|nr:hypothetical protein [Pyrinomonadaceae bacterium]
MINKTNIYHAALLLTIALGLVVFIYGQQKPQTTNGQLSQKSMDEMNERGDKAMGFDHTKTTHHFLLAEDGGSIQVEANDPKDKESRDQIRMHFRHITMMFSDGQFDIPMLVHAQTPPGAEVMKRLKAEITYTFKVTERGGMILISTKNSEALRAIHDFLRFQIKEHMTGDPLDVSTASKTR